MAHYKANKHRGRHVHRLFSKKNNSVIKVESFLERIYCHSIELLKPVKMYASQPETMRLSTNDSYTPDFLVVYQSGFSEYIEVHHSVFMSEAFEQKVQRFSDYAKRTTGREIRIVTERDIDLRFAKTFEQVLFQLADKIPESLVLNSLPKRIYFESLVASLATYYDNPVSIAYRLIADGLYEVDFSQLITLNTELTLTPALQGGASC
jgi:hypothetical protein